MEVKMIEQNTKKDEPVLSQKLPMGLVDVEVVVLAAVVLLLTKCALQKKVGNISWKFEL